jgi:hypothetical protein
MAPAGSRSGPVLKKIAADLALQRLPDLSAFTEEQIDEEWLPLFSKSGLYSDSVALLQDLVRQASLGLITMETARAQDVKGWAPEKWLWTDFQRVEGLFGTQIVMINMGEPRFQFVDPVAPPP